MDPRAVRALCQLREMCSEGRGATRQTLALPVSPLELNTGSGGGVPGALPHATTRAGGGNQIESAEGCACSFRWIWSRWHMPGNEDAPNGPDAWAALSWRAGTRRAYAPKLAKIAEFQEASGEMSMAGVLAEFLAARVVAGERQSTLRGYNAAVRAAEDRGWIGSVLQQPRKRIAQATSKVGFQP